jgi:hypothetical protein
MRVEIEVDELVLVGFDPRDRLRVADAVERGLAARAASIDASALARGAADVAEMRAPDVAVARGAAGARPETVGELAGGSIARGLGALGGSGGG